MGNRCEKQARILLVEDNPSDAKLVKIAASRSLSGSTVEFATDGSSALSRLHCRDLPLPDIILLDLNMPVMNGFEFLRRVKADDSIRRIPVVVLTTSDAPGDIKAAYNLHANAYLLKDLEFEEFLETFSAMEAFWFGRALLSDE